MKRIVGEESSKTYEEKLASGFFKKYMAGLGLEIGYKGYLPNVQPILDTAIGIDLDYPGYDGLILPFSDKSQDYVYSSHVLEHIEEWWIILDEWFRVIKPKGHLVIIVPHKDLYEKKNHLPSRFNADHKRFYNSSRLLYELEQSLSPKSYRIRHLRENDEGHDYSQSPEEHSKWLYEIECVIQKL